MKGHVIYLFIVIGLAPFMTFLMLWIEAFILKFNKKPCEVKGCNKIGVKHYENYNKPLEVNWLCVKHFGKFYQTSISLEKFLEVTNG